MSVIQLWLLTLLLLSIQGLPDVPSTSTPVISIAPSVIYWRQVTPIHLYGVQPFRVKCVTKKLEQDLVEIDEEPLDVWSEPEGDIHFAKIDYVYPLRRPRAIHSKAGVELNINLVNESLGEENRSFVLHHRFVMQNAWPIVLLESSSPVYNPGDTVRFISWHVSPEIWTRSEVISDQNLTYPFIDSAPYTVSVEDPQRTFEKSWAARVQSKTELYEFVLPSNASRGQWTVRLTSPFWSDYERLFRVIDRNESLEPNIRLVVSNHWKNHKQNIVFNVCVNDTDGYPYRHSQVHLLAGNCERLTEPVIATAPKCSIDIDREDCQVCVLDLDDNGCATSDVPIRPMFRDQPLACVQVHSLVREKSYAKCVEIEPPKPEFRAFPKYHKYGLPTLVKFNPDKLGQTENFFLLQWEETPELCTKWDIPPSMNGPQKMWNPPVDESGDVEFVIPPVFTTSPVQLRLYALRRNGFCACETYLVRLPIMDEIVENIQIWPPSEYIQVPCNQSVKLTIYGTEPLHDKQLMIYLYIRGQLVVIRPEELTDHLEEDTKCEDQDGYMGHYACPEPDSDYVECLPGWKGVGCLEPVCSSDCELNHGFCTSPLACQCKNGWLSPNCTIRDYSNWLNYCALPSDHYQCVGEVPIQGFTQPIVELTNVTETFNSSRAFHRRTIEFSLNLGLLDQTEVPFVVFYIKPLSESAITAVSSHGLLIYRPIDCPWTEHEIQVDVDETSTGSTVQLTIRPNLTSDNNVIECILQVWSESNLTDSYWQKTRNDLLLDKLKAEFKNHRSRFQNKEPPGTAYEFAQGGLSFARETDDPMGHLWEEQRPCGLYLGVLPYSETLIPTLNSHLFRINSIASNGDGIIRNITLPDSSWFWRAGALCFAPKAGIWTGTSPPIQVAQRFELRISSSTSSVRWFETANIQAEVSVTGSMGDRYLCAFVLLEFKVVWEAMRLIGPHNYTRFLCIHNGSERFETQVIPHAFLTGPVTIQARLYTLSKTIRCTGNELSGDCIPPIIPKKLLRVATHSIHVRMDSIKYVSSSRMLLCFHGLDHGYQRIDFELPSVKTNSTLIRTYFRYSYTTVDLVLMTFTTIVADELNVDDGLHHLAIVFIGSQIIHHIESNDDLVHITVKELEPYVYKSVKKSFETLNSFRCLYNSSAPPLYFYSQHCGTVDLDFTSLVYETFFSIRNVRMIPSYGTIWLNITAIMNDIITFLQALQDPDDCINPTGSTSLESLLSINSMIYIRLRPSSDHYYSFSIGSLDQMLRALERCLYNSLVNAPYSVNTTFRRSDTMTLVRLARALGQMTPRRNDWLATLRQLIDDRAIVRTMSFGQQQPNLHQIFWSDVHDRRSALEITAHAYMWMNAESEKVDNYSIGIARWVSGESDFAGKYKRSLDAIWGTMILTDFAKKIENRKSRNVRFLLEAHAPLYESQVDEPGFKWMNPEQLEVTEHPEAMVLTIKSSQFDNETCVLSEVACLYPTTPIESQNHGSFQLKSTVVQSTCSAAQLIICFTPSNHSTQLLVRTQSGWRFTRYDAKYRSSPSRSRSIRGGLRESVTVFASATNVRFTLKALNTTKNISACFKLFFVSTGVVRNTEPFRITLSDLENSGHSVSVTSAKFNNCLEMSHLQVINRRPQPGPCPVIISEIENDPFPHMNVTQVCHNDLQLLHLPSLPPRTTQIHRIGKSGFQTSWITKIHPDSIHCFPTTTNTSHQWYLVFPEDLADFSPEDMFLNLRCSGRYNEPIKLFPLPDLSRFFGPQMLHPPCLAAVALGELFKHTNA